MIASPSQGGIAWKRSSMQAIASSHAAGATAAPPPIPFDTARLDALMEEAGIDALLVTSKHNIQYLLGGYRFFFFDHFDAIGVSRYLPILVYVKGHPESAAYVGHPMESYEHELGQFWVPKFSPSARMSTDGIEAAIAELAARAPSAKRIGVERAFLPADAESVLRRGLPQMELVEAQLPLERLRAVKSPQELESLRIASDLVVEFHARGHRRRQAGRDQARIGRGAAPRGSGSRAHLRILPHHRREPASTGRRPTRFCARATSSPSTRAATTKAISATSAGWAFSASRTRSSRTCSMRST